MILTSETLPRVGKIVRAARVKKGVKQCKVAQRIGVSNATMCRIENGIWEPSLQNLMKLCEVMGWELVIREKKA